MFGVVVLALLCNAPCVPAPADTAITWRYDLRAGDHLVYRELFRQEIDGRAAYGLDSVRDKPPGTPFVSAGRYEWSSHLLVLNATDDRLLVGVQRDRAREDSIATSLDSSSALSAADRARFQSRLRGRAIFAQANLLTVTGDAMRPWAARREMRSKILWDLFELPPLPANPVRVGDRWQSTDPFAFEMRVAGTDTIGGESCLRAEGTASAAALIPRQVADSSGFVLEFWYCPASHAVKRVVLEGTYPDVNFYKVHETAVFNLAGRTRGESPAEWTRSADVRQGVLAAAALGDSGVMAAILATPGVDSIYAGADTASARMLLSLAFRSGAGAAPPAPTAMVQLLASDDPRVRTLAVRMLARGDAAGAREQLERAAADSDYFVRAAAARALHTDSARESTGALACALPDSTREQLARARRSAQAGSPSGTTFRGMASQPFRGWPYGIYVPDDYLGDEPFPLIIYLAGNSGPAIEGVQLASPAFERTGYLVVYPNGWGGWWRTNTETMVDSLLKEVMRKYNVDPGRVYLSGLSNGGTGTFDYASLWPQRWSAAVVAMGAGLFGFTEPGGDRPFVANVTHVPMLFLHGKRDQVIEVAAATKTVDSLRAQHADVAMKIFPERGHEIVPGTGDDGATVDFFQHHESRAIPKKVYFTAATTAHARHYWIEILEKESPAAGNALDDDAGIPDAVRARLGSLVRAEVRGSIDDHGTIRLDAQHVRRLRLLLRPDLFTAVATMKVVLNGKTVFDGPLPNDCALYTRTLADYGDPWLAYSAEMTFDVPR
jgi:poly(3-hydroxybutyrate) depolymerase